MSDIFGISVSALQAFQTAISVTSNNVANANTPGYDKESVDLTEGVPQSNGIANIGSGVVVSAISRAYSQAATTQLNTSQSSLGQLNGLQNYTSQIDNLFGTTAGGLSTALQSYYSAWSDVANDPTSTASRQALLSQAQSVASSFQNTSSQLNALNTDVNNRLTSDVQQINTIAASISTLNKQIVVATAQDGGQPPNDLLDQRDQLVSNLSQLTGVTTTTNADGALSVFVGKGQPLVLDGTTSTLTLVPDQFNAAQLDVSTSSSGGHIIDSTLTTGDVGGLLAARTQAINPALNQLGQIATALSQTANAQQSTGIDLNGKLGTPIFSIGTPQAHASSQNTDGTTAAVSISNVGALTADDYVLSYVGGAYSLTRSSDGTSVALEGAGTAASPLEAEGISIVLSALPVNGDQFLIQPTAQTAASLSVVLTDPTKIAAAGAVVSSAASANTGSGTISAGTVLDPTNPNLLTATTIQFTSPSTYSVNGASSTYTDGADITSPNGWQVQISGAPATGDSFTVTGNTAGSGDNRNALASAAQQTKGVLGNGATSINGAVSGLITGIGSQAQQVNTAQAAQTAVNTQALSSVQSISGVNLDEEAANLLQWQQAYQASAQALNIGNSLFSTLLAAVNGGSPL